MDPVFLSIVAIMFLLAVTDLVAGVSNDADNFLNAAIGSNAASVRTIMVIAILLSSKDMVAICSRLIKLFYRVKNGDLEDVLDKLMKE